jgi:hypothetical protein
MAGRGFLHHRTRAGNGGLGGGAPGFGKQMTADKQGHWERGDGNVVEEKGQAVANLGILSGPIS